jgi:hypothetical protein
MKTKTITLYSFDELSEEGKKKAINNLSTINVDYQWWDSTYEDAKRIGLTINAFDTDHYCKGDLTNSLSECCELIKQEHGEKCETYKTAIEYLAKWSALVKKYSDGVNTDRVAEDNEYAFDQDADDLEADFTKSLLEDYRIILRKEYEYLTSEEAIIETIKCNEYTFTEDGKLENA